MPLNPNPIRRTAGYASFLLAAVLLPASASAQSVAPANGSAPAKELPKSTADGVKKAAASRDDEIIELSPFMVDTSQDRGYESANTLSGTRLSTPAKYVGAAAFELTPAMMADLSLTNFQDLIDFAPNSSSNGMSINDTNGNGALFGPGYAVRGLAVSSLTRDFVNNRAADDAYNTEQFSFTRGPNSILFGIGNPGGITNSISKRARFIDTYQLAFRADTNDSLRGTFDVNKVILKNRVAVRIAGLKEENHTNRKPSDRRANRLYGAVTLKPFANTTIRANSEHGRINALNVRPWSASDGLSGWINAGSKDIPAGMEAGAATYARVTTVPAGQPSVAVNTATLLAAGYEIQNPNPLALVVLNSAQPLPTLTMMGFISTARLVAPGGDNRMTLVNSPIPYTANVLGYGNRLVQNIASHTLALEQRIGKDLFVEVLFNRQRYNNWNDYSSGSLDNIYLDKQKTVLTWDNQVINNPNYGRYFLYNTTLSALHTNYVDQTGRVMASYALDLSKKAEGWLGKLLGHHNFAAMGEQVSYDYAQSSAFLAQMTPEAIKSTPRFPAAAVTNIQSSSNRMGGVSYFTPGDESTYPFRDTFNDYPRMIFDGSPLPAAKTDGVTPGWIVVTSVRSLQEIKSRMFVAQDFFWDDKIVTTFGFRHDDSNLWNVPTQNNAANRMFTIDATTRDPKALVTPINRNGNTYTQGVVVSPISWLGVFYNRSSSFVPPAAQVDINGEPLPNGDGKGQDYGIKLSLLRGRLHATLSRYTTDYNSVPSTVLRSGATNLSTPRLAIQQAMSNTVIGGPGGPMWDGSDSHWAPSTTVLNGINDVKSRGYEISLTANPTGNFRVTANFSHQDTKTSNFGKTEAKWLDDVAFAYFNAHPQYLGILTGPGLQNNNETITQRLQDMRTIMSLAQTLNGKSDTRQSQYSANLVTGYDVSEGMLKGFGIGGMYRWRQKSILGYAYVTGRTDLFDTSKVFYGDDTHVLGTFAYYRFKKWGTSARIQLNVNGLNNDERLHPYAAVDKGDGTPLITRYILGPGRNYSLTTTFDF